ncbi:hypothetical protein D3C84_1253490 [compost metagenome]
MTFWICHIRVECDPVNVTEPFDRLNIRVGWRDSFHLRIVVTVYHFIKSEVPPAVIVKFHF